ncbi:MAG: phosphotransferase family protein [Actinobacteria bacterium]|nr:phosphotransferase family protein [Actinomycetota bacterium]
MNRTESEALADWLVAVLDWSAVESFHRISEGHSREMVVATATNGERVVVRIEQGGVFGTDGIRESRLMTGLHEHGVPVARVLAGDERGVVMGRRFFVMEYVPSVPGKPPPVGDFIGVLHAMHGIDPTSGSLGDLLGVSNVANVREATMTQVRRWRDVYRSSTDEPVALLERSAEWLMINAPEGDRLSVVHGDAGPDNFVHDGKRVLAITDWEFGHVGDPMEDWVFCIQMRGSRALPKDEWLGQLATITGIRIAPEVWRYWEAFNYFKGSCANLTCRRLYETGANPAPNMAIVGTAVYRMFLQKLIEFDGAV